jgi:hypothetical protein
MTKSKKDNPLNTIGGLSVYKKQNQGKSCKGKYSLKYSVDKVKIEFQWVKVKVVQQFLDKLMSNSCDMEYTNYYESNKMTNCKHNFNYGEGEGGIYLGVIPNWRKEERHDKNIVLEYNPNKVDPFMFDTFAWLTKLPLISWRVMSFDIAVDVMIPYNTVCMLKRDMREYMCSVGHSDVETRYLGTFGANGHIKLYNKAKEQKMEGLDWTRFEITIKKINHPTPTLDDFKKACKVPTLYRKDIQLSTTETSDIWNLALETVIQDTTLLYTIKNYRSRKKMEQLLHEVLESIPISVEDMYETYINFFEELVAAKLEVSDEYVDIDRVFFNQQQRQYRTSMWFKYNKNTTKK